MSEMTSSMAYPFVDPSAVAEELRQSGVAEEDIEASVAGAMGITAAIPAPDPVATVQADAEFMDVYVIATGEHTSVPAHYRDNPVLWAGLRKTPLSEDQQRAADALMASVNPDDTPAAGDKE